MGCVISPPNSTALNARAAFGFHLAGTLGGYLLTSMTVLVLTELHSC